MSRAISNELTSGGCESRTTVAENELVGRLAEEILGGEEMLHETLDVHDLDRNARDGCVSKPNGSDLFLGCGANVERLDVSVRTQESLVMRHGIGCTGIKNPAGQLR